MNNSTIKAALAAAVLYMLSALPALAADIVVKIDQARQRITVTSTLATPVNLLYLKGDDRNLSVGAKLAKGATVTVPLRSGIPGSISGAVGEISGQRVELTVEIIQ